MLAECQQKPYRGVLRAAPCVAMHTQPDWVMLKGFRRTSAAETRTQAALQQT